MNQAIHQDGSDHYKTGKTEPIDLMESGGMLHDFALASIIKYAFRCRKEQGREPSLVIKDMEKVKHYATMVQDLHRPLFHGGSNG